MKNSTFILFTVLVGATLTAAAGRPGPKQSGAASSQPVRPIGVVTEIQTGQMTLHTDSGPKLTVNLPDGVSVLRVPPGAKSLASATKIAVGDISIGDRVLIIGPVSADQKSILARRVIVMSKSALEQAHEAEQLDWEQRGIGGIVKSVDSLSHKMVIAVPSTPPTPGNPTHLVTISLEPQAKLLRYAPDSIKFSDAKPGTFGEIEVGDQVRALGNKSANGTQFTAEKLVSGTFRNIGGTVISVDAAQGTLTVKDLATGKPLLVRTDADSQLHQLPPRIAQIIARFNIGGEKPGQPESGGTARVERGRRPGASGEQEAKRENGGDYGNGQGKMPGSLQEMLGKMPPLTLSELKPGEPLIVVSTAGAKPSEVTAIAVLSGVEPILRARPKGDRNVALGPWNMSMGSGGGGGEETGP
ncbi:MAG TPA: hypothetical protein VMW54_11260 [Terriglobia bacterium]|nr:hypothetical protein [Terriglobia bacterium]